MTRTQSIKKLEPVYCKLISENTIPLWDKFFDQYASHVKAMIKKRKDYIKKLEQNDLMNGINLINVNNKHEEKSKIISTINTVEAEANTLQNMLEYFHELKEAYINTSIESANTCSRMQEEINWVRSTNYVYAIALASLSE